MCHTFGKKLLFHVQFKTNCFLRVQSALSNVEFHQKAFSFLFFFFLKLNKCDSAVFLWPGLNTSLLFSDGSPTEQGVDHRQVQRELGEVSVYLQKPVVLSPNSARISWTVSWTLDWCRSVEDTLISLKINFKPSFRTLRDTNRLTWGSNAAGSALDYWC